MIDRARIEATLASYDTREEEIAQHLADLEVQAANAQGRRFYAAIQRAYARELAQIAMRRPLLHAMLSDFSQSEKVRTRHRKAQCG